VNKIVANRGLKELEHSRHRKQSKRDKISGDVHPAQTDQLADLKEIVFTPKPITAGFLLLFSREIEKKVGSFATSSPPFVCV
jgi:hypothetical protein